MADAQQRQVPVAPMSRRQNPAEPVTALPRAHDKREASTLVSSRHATPTIPPPSTAANMSVPNIFPNGSIPASSAPNFVHPPPQATSSAGTHRQPALVQMARTANKQGEIAKAQDIIKWLYHHLNEFGLKKELKVWGRMALPEIPPQERRAIYANLAKIVDRLLRDCGHGDYFTDPRHRPCLEALFDEGAPGTAPQGTVPSMPNGVGRLISPSVRPVIGQASNQAGSSRLTNGENSRNGSSGGIMVPQLETTSLARPSAQLVTPQQRAAMARSAVPPEVAQVVTQPRQPSLPSASNSQAIGSIPTQIIDIPCPFCREVDHSILTCQKRRLRPLELLKKDLTRAQSALLVDRPGSVEARKSAAMVRCTLNRDEH